MPHAAAVGPPVPARNGRSRPGWVNHHVVACRPARHPRSPPRPSGPCWPRACGPSYAAAGWTCWPVWPGRWPPPGARRHHEPTGTRHPAAGAGRRSRPGGARPPPPDRARDPDAGLGCADDAPAAPTSRDRPYRRRRPRPHPTDPASRHGIHPTTPWRLTAHPGAAPASSAIRPRTAQPSMPAAAEPELGSSGVLWRDRSVWDGTCQLPLKPSRFIRLAGPACRLTACSRLVDLVTAKRDGSSF
jgi:hypothetical protein